VTIRSIGIGRCRRASATPQRRDADMDVGALSMATLLALVAAWGWVIAARRRAARRAAEMRARQRARRRRIPTVSANVRGLPGEQQDLWARESADASHDRRAS
jgi:hypothetical protein